MFLVNDKPENDKNVVETVDQIYQHLGCEPLQHDEHAKIHFFTAISTNFLLSYR